MTDPSKELREAFAARQKRLQEAPMTAAEIQAEENRIRALYLQQVLDPDNTGWHSVPNLLAQEQNNG